MWECSHGFLISDEDDHMQSWLLLFAAASISISKLLVISFIKLLLLKKIVFVPSLDKSAEHSLQSVVLLLSSFVLKIC